jgi:hypothetical protein
VHFFKKKGSPRVINSDIARDMSIAKRFEIGISEFSRMTFAQKRTLYYVSLIEAFNESIEHEHHTEQMEMKRDAQQNRPQLARRTR